MTGYIKTNIEFSEIQKDLDAAKALNDAGREDEAKKVLIDMRAKIKKEIKL